VLNEQKMGAMQTKGMPLQIKLNQGTASSRAGSSYANPAHQQPAGYYQQ